MVPAELLGAAIEDGTAIGEGQERSELPSMPGSAASSRYVSGHAVLFRLDLRLVSGHPSPASISARHTSMMSTTPRRPASPATGR